MSQPLPSIQDATRDYERWLEACLGFVDAKGLAKKHEAMDKGPFEFLRATFYRWMQRWAALGGTLHGCPTVLAVGDLHVENFGTWKDVEGRLVWGMNDFDEAFRLPYIQDLVRLATSARLAIANRRLRIKPGAACQAILRGYSKSLRAGGEPIILGEERHDWLRRLAQGLWESWEPLAKLEKAKDVPRDARAALQRALPRGVGPDVRERRAGLGSLGKPRFVALGVSHGGTIAREAKAITPSACAWAAGVPGRSLTSIAVARAVRSPDPFYETDGSWLLRRLAPDCGKLEMEAKPALPDSARLLEYMGHETANIHLGTRGARERILADLAQRPGSWLKAASASLLEATTEDWEAWRGGGRRNSRPALPGR